MKNRQVPPVLIIGAHRSGTTATARALELLGLQLGEHLDSHREPRNLQKLHEKYLRQLGGAWYNPKPFLDQVQNDEGQRACEDYLRQNVDAAFARIFGYRKNPKGLWLLARLKSGGLWGWKEPRTTLFAPAWLKIFPGARVLHVMRDPLAAARSIRERELEFQAAGDPPSGKLDDLNYCLELVRIYFTAGERVSGLANYRRVRFEDIQAHPAETLKDLATFCGLQFGSQQLAAAAATIRPGQMKPAYQQPVI